MTLISCKLYSLPWSFFSFFSFSFFFLLSVLYMCVGVLVCLFFLFFLFSSSDGSLSAVAQWHFAHRTLHTEGETGYRL